MLNRFDGNVVPFASEATLTNRTVFGAETQSDDIDDNLNADFKKGWEIVGLNDNPTREDFNAMGYTLGNLISYLYQNGVAEWNDKQEYKINSIAIGTDGNIYQSLVDSNIGNALTDTTKWVCIASKNSIVNSIAELKTISNIESINVLGYYEKGDGGGGLFYWDSTSTETDDGGYTIQATGINPGRWKRPIKSESTLKEWGAISDVNFSISGNVITCTGTNNYNSLLNAINNCSHIIIDEDYGISTNTPIKLKDNQTLEFKNNASLYYLTTSNNTARCMIELNNIKKAKVINPSIFGIGNKGLSKALIDGLSIIQSTECEIYNLRTKYTKRHGLFMMESNDNQIVNPKVTETNRQMLGCGIQLQGSSYNTIKNAEMYKIGSNGLDLNISTVGDGDSILYGVTAVGLSSTYNNIDIDVMRDVANNNTNIGENYTLATVIADDDYYGINIIQGSDYNIININNIENVGSNLPVGGDTYLSSIRLYNSSNNIINIEKISNIYNGTKDLLKLDGDVNDTIINIEKAFFYSNVFNSSVTFLGLKSKVKIGNYKSVDGYIKNTDFKYIHKNNTTHTYGILAGWYNNYGTTVSVSNGELTITSDGSSDKYFATALQSKGSPFLVVAFEYKTNSSNTHSSVGLVDSPYSIVGLPASTSFVETTILLPISTDSIPDFGIWANKGGGSNGDYITIRNLCVYAPNGDKFTALNDKPKLMGIPTAGTYENGDIIYPLSVSAGGYAGWICTTAGSPGTWKTFGVISA